MRFDIFTSIIIYCIPVVLCILAYKYKNKYFIFAFLIYIFLIAAFRFNVASDFGRYYNRAFYRTELGLSLNEPLEMLFFFVSSKAGLPRLFFMLNAAVISVCGFILYMQYKNAEHYELMFIAYYLVVLVGNYITRYCAAVAVASVGVYFLINESKNKRNILYYLLTVLLAFCFHSGAIVSLAFPLLIYFYDLIKRDRGIRKYAYTIMMGALSVLLPLVVFLGDLTIRHSHLFDKFSLYFEYFKESIPDSTLMIVLMAAALCVTGFLFDMISMACHKNRYIKVFSIGSMVFVSFIIIALFQNQYLLDIIRIGIIYGFQSIILYTFVMLDISIRKENKAASRIPIYVLTSIYACLLVFCAIWGSPNSFPYNTDTTVSWGSDSTYEQKFTGY